ncbi:hypothetical protein ABK249_02720 [Neorhizobium sp. Rsf11]|uniref:Uncharacterized protein n=1 Tax=Neorhizobium phenanthreniclasticum TaxID=3157917 RepID=A0ABV0LYJ7_9HYPH
MAWMIVYREGNFRRPNSKYSFNFKPGPVAQSWPQDVVDYAVSQGKAERVDPPRRRKAIASRAG